VKSLHMPEWAGAGSAAQYWRAAEGRDSRENARTAILIECAIPKNLTPEQQEALVLELAEEIASMCSAHGQIVGKLPLIVALHEGFGRNPHIHILLSTSIADGFVRNARTWFRRYNPKNPSSGGARRSEFVAKLGWLYKVRKAWARLANAALQRCGLPPALDHRSHAARGLTTEPQIHLGPAVAHMMRQGYATARSRKYVDIERRKEEDRAREDALKRRRKLISALEREWIALDHAASECMLACNRDLRELLKDHPLGVGLEGLAANATAFVTEFDMDSPSMPGNARPAAPDLSRFGNAVGAAWLAVSTGDAVWAVKPEQDSVVMLAHRYAATDAKDAESMQALIRAASVLPLVRPKLSVQEWMKRLSIDLLRNLGLEWPVEGLVLQPPRRKLGP
jgi:hypothetical protein